MLKLRHLLAVVGIAAMAAAGATATSAAGVTTAADVASIQPAGQTVGVAHPVTVTFRRAVDDRAAAERSFTVSTPDAPSGSFSWLSDRVLEWTPDEFWPAHSTIALSVGHTKATFQTGASVVSVADINSYSFTVSIDGVVAREMPASMGKSGFATPTGRFTALTKEPVVVMDSRTIGIPLSDPEGYKLTVYNAVRVNWGGVYVHGAPWSVGSQGYANVSHGCINLSPDNAAWYFDTVSIGDPIIIQY